MTPPPRRRSAGRRGALRRRGESGQAAGLETIPFGILVFVAGTLLVARAWATVDTYAAADAAARDYLRAYTAAPDVGAARAAGEAAATASIAARRGASTRFSIEAPGQAFGACEPASATVTIRLPGVHLPFAGEVGSTEVSATETDVVQPFDQATPLENGACPR